MGIIGSAQLVSSCKGFTLEIGNCSTNKNTPDILLTNISYHGIVDCRDYWCLKIIKKNEWLMLFLPSYLLLERRKRR